MSVESGLPHYDHIKGKLSGSQITKARKFVTLGKVVKLSNDRWFVSFIPGYNTRMYIINKSDDDFTCNCQYNKTKNLTCSHIMAVMIFEGYDIE